jgi:hypothetical protein
MTESKMKKAAYLKRKIKSLQERIRVLTWLNNVGWFMSIVTPDVVDIIEIMVKDYQIELKQLERKFKNL